MSDLKATCFGSKEWPTVSVVVPVRNEAQHLERTVASILAQEYPLEFDICLAVGPSDDGTEQLAETIAGRLARVSIVPNPTGRTPAALNAAIGATEGDAVVRVDGHAELPPGYIRRAIGTMRRTGAINVGGLQSAKGTTPFEESVAAAMTSRFGTGGSRFHVGGDEGPVDTVYLGVFDRAAGDEVGWFDESLIRNQDYELNIRLRKAGGTVWFDPELSVTYRPRNSLCSLGKQYREYGRWKAVVICDHPESIRARQLVPVLATAALALSTVGALRNARLLFVPLGYVAMVVSAALLSARGSAARARHLVLVFPTMHLSWGAGFARGLVFLGTSGLRRRTRRFRAASQVVRGTQDASRTHTLR